MVGGGLLGSPSGTRPGTKLEARLVTDSPTLLGVVERLPISPSSGVSALTCALPGLDSGGRLPLAPGGKLDWRGGG